MDRIITVTGEGRACVPPDMAVVAGQLTGEYQEYAEAVKAAGNATAALRKAVGEAGFDMDDLKTGSFSVSPVYRHENDGRAVFRGYRFSRSVEIRVDSDSESLGRIMAAMTGCAGAPEFRVSYGVRDPSAAVSEARQAAVKDARRKAKELAAAAEVRLGELVSITYGPAQSRPVVAARMMSMNVDSEPEDVEFADTVTLVWSIA